MSANNPPAPNIYDWFAQRDEESYRDEARNSARVKVTAGHLGWADLIFCMERKHADRLRDRFSKELAGKTLITLRIPDDCDFMDPALIKLLRAELGPHLGL